MKSSLHFTIVFALLSGFAHAQSPNATIAGRVLDPSSAVLSDAKVEAINLYTNIHYAGQTNREGAFVIPSLPPGPYRIEVSKSGFKTAVREDVVLRVQDIVALNFTLPVGSITESVTVTGGAPLVNTQDATVSTVIDRNFAENLPLNGRSFQTLIALSPGVVLTPANQADPGQFSVNGQRTGSNYFMVDGVSANIGTLPFVTLSQSASGATPGFSVTGGTNNLVSEDALQEFRIQTSTYAPEFGRTPGAQVSIVTRSGTNAFHGALFEFLRNDKLDASDWFANLSQQPKPEERINDFGGVFGGPVIKDRTFFFFSYEGQRLRLPKTSITNVPSLADRQAPTPTNIQPFLNAYPLPNVSPTQFAASFSNQASLDAVSLRLDHKVNDQLSVFGRYDYAPSDSLTRGPTPPNVTNRAFVDTQTLTLGTNWNVTQVANNDFRFNYSRVAASSSQELDGFGGAIVPPDASLFPAPITRAQGNFAFVIFGLSSWSVGKNGDNLQRQFNIVDNFSLQKGQHSLKFGMDYRRLSPDFSPFAYQLAPVFLDVQSAIAGNPFLVLLESNKGTNVLFRNLGLFAQDTWRAAPRLTLTYGLRWDIDFTPTSLSGPPLAAVTNFNANDLSTLALAAAGTPIFKTKYRNFAPRFGIAYMLRQKQEWETVLRGGAGVYYDLATTHVGDALQFGDYPFGVNVNLCSFCPAGPAPSFPFDPAAVQPPQVSLATLPFSSFVGFDPHLQAPHIYQWNLALEQSLGSKQALSASYIGAIGRRLLQEEESFLGVNPSIGLPQLVLNGATSDYHALQLQFQRRMSRGFQALASYTYSHSLDTASSGSTGLFGGSPNIFITGENPNLNRGSSDFDIRHTFSTALAYAIPVPVNSGSILRAIAGGWSVNNIFQARGATPVGVYDTSVFAPNGSLAGVRPDLTGQPTYVTQCANPIGGSPAQIPCPGGRGLNPNAFVDPPVDPNTGSAVRQGNLGRNAVRGLGAWQWDFAVRREFQLHDTWRLQFRSELFNILNHPNFANPVADLSGSLGTFGVSPSMLAGGLSPEPGGGGFAQIFQLGGPRSIQFALKLTF